MLILIETTIAAAWFATALVMPRFGRNWLDHGERLFTRLAQSRKLSLLVVGLVALGLRLAVLPVEPVPAPTVDDEFGYLLQADTFLHGRLTNPPHPMWEHFETFHINMLPTYHAKFPPAQGAALAAGKLIGGQPIVGVWLSMAAMCAAICWMLQEWISAQWALAGALLLAMRLSPFSYWADSYWGGAVAATGGALVLGAFVRMRRSTRLRDAMLMGLGIAILANSRPFEGLVLCIPISATLFFRWAKKDAKELAHVWRRTILPLTLCVAMTVIAIGYYNWRLTGNALLLPYQLNERTYSAAALFIFETPHAPPAYRHAALRDFYLLNDLSIYQNTQSARALLISWYERYKVLWQLLLGPLLSVPIVLALFARSDQPASSERAWHNRFLFWAGVIAVAGLCMEVYGLPHYAAPFTALIVALIVSCMRRMRRWEIGGKPVGVFLCRTLPFTLLLMLGLRAAAIPLHLDAGPAWPPAWYNGDSKRIPRTDLERKLNGLPGQHLVIVHYLERGDASMPHEWVYNAADIDASKIVWAWDMGPQKNQELIDYFQGRQVWYVNSDGTAVSPSPKSKTSNLADSLNPDN